MITVPNYKELVRLADRCRKHEDGSVSLWYTTNEHGERIHASLHFDSDAGPDDEVETARGRTIRGHECLDYVRAVMTPEYESCEEIPISALPEEERENLWHLLYSG